MLKKLWDFLTGTVEIEPIIIHPYVTATTPDQIIVEAVKESIAKHFDDWRRVDENFMANLPVGKRNPNRFMADFGLYNEKKEVLVSHRGQGISRPEYNFFVNDLKIADVDGHTILNVYKKLKGARDQAERVAKEAVERMEREEKAWNMAENLLGLKRNDQGALVPKDQGV